MADKSFPLRVVFEHAPEGKPESAPGSDLSLGGVFIETATKLPVGALLSLEIESGTMRVALEARILSCRAAGGADRPAGLAVSFIDLPNDVAANLHFILATRTPRKGTMLGLGEAEDDIPTYESEPKLPTASASAAHVASASRPPPPVPSKPPPLPRRVPKPATAVTKDAAPPMSPRASPVTAGAGSTAAPRGAAPAPASSPLARAAAGSPLSTPPPRPQLSTPPPASASPATPVRRRIGPALVVVGVILLLLAVATAMWVIRQRPG